MHERLRRMKDGLIPPGPSQEWMIYFENTRQGQNEQIPVCDKGNNLVFDYYGMNSKIQVEQARFILPYSGGMEISYHITRHLDGSFESVREGIFPKST